MSSISFQFFQGLVGTCWNTPCDTCAFMREGNQHSHAQTSSHNPKKVNVAEGLAEPPWAPLSGPSGLTSAWFKEQRIQTYKGILCIRAVQGRHQPTVPENPHIYMQGVVGTCCPSTTLPSRATKRQYRHSSLPSLDRTVASAQEMSKEIHADPEPSDFQVSRSTISDLLE